MRGYRTKFALAQRPACPQRRGGMDWRLWRARAPGAVFSSDDGSSEAISIPLAGIIDISQREEG